VNLDLALGQGLADQRRALLGGAQLRGLNHLGPDRRQLRRTRLAALGRRRHEADGLLLRRAGEAALDPAELVVMLAQGGRDLLQQVAEQADLGRQFVEGRARRGGVGLAHRKLVEALHHRIEADGIGGEPDLDLADRCENLLALLRRTPTRQSRGTGETGDSSIAAAPSEKPTTPLAAGERALRRMRAKGFQIARTG
jgi:hypothetical protein